MPGQELVAERHDEDEMLWAARPGSAGAAQPAGTHSCPEQQCSNFPGKF